MRRAYSVTGAVHARRPSLSKVAGGDPRYCSRYEGQFGTKGPQIVHRNVWTRSPRRGQVSSPQRIRTPAQFRLALQAADPPDHPATKPSGRSIISRLRLLGAFWNPMTFIGTFRRDWLSNIRGDVLAGIVALALMPPMCSSMRLWSPGIGSGRRTGAPSDICSRLLQ